MASRTAKPQPTLRVKTWRVRGTFIVFVVLAVALIGRLFVLQVQQHDVLTQRGDNQHLQSKSLPAERGNIYDRNGNLLAGNATAYDLYADLTHLPKMEDRRTLADSLAQLTDSSPEDMFASLSAQITGTRKLRANLTDDQKDRLDAVMSDHSDSLWLEAHSRRTYPNGNLLATVLGYANSENVGAYGLEGAYEKVLGGKPGLLKAEYDATGTEIPLGQRQYEPPVDGQDIYLTIDMNVQFIAERNLDEGMRATGAKSGQVVILDPKSGEILALAARPTFDPNNYSQYTNDLSLFRNPVVNDIYEPGSTFKVLTWAMGVNEGKITPDFALDLPACRELYRQRICNHDRTAHAAESMETGLAISDNIAAMKIAEMVSKDRFYQYLKQWGIGQTSGAGFGESEEPGLVYFPGDKGWNDLNFYTNSFGQGIAITPLQMVVAIVPVANGGNLMQPYIMQKIVDKHGVVVKQSSPQVKSQLLSPDAAQMTTEMMEAVVERGTGRLAKTVETKAYRIAAKTGTAQVPLRGGGYDPNNSIGGVVGFAPAEDAKFVALVKLDRPTSSQWGELTAVPIFGYITRDLLTYYNVQPPAP